VTILSTIMGVESGGGHNVVQGNIGDINNQTGDLAKGYFQITNATWAQFGGLSTGYTQANAAPYATQLQIAQNIPVARWGPDTQSALSAAGYGGYSRGTTLGQLMASNGENPSATVAADGSTVTGSGSTLAQGPADQTSGANPNTSDPLGSSVTMNPSGTSPTTSSGTGAQGTPIQTGLQPEEVSQIGTWITGIENAFGGGLKTTLTAAETGVATWLGSFQNWFTRAGLIVLGIVLIAIALIVIMWDHGGKETVVNIQKAAAA
jgi:SLT domain-containing protein